LNRQRLGRGQEALLGIELLLEARGVLVLEVLARGHEVAVGIEEGLDVLSGKF